MKSSIARRGLPRLFPLLLGAAGLAALYYATARPALLVVDGVQTELRTHSKSPIDLIAEAGIDLGPNDQLLPSRDATLAWEAGAVPVVELSRARTVILEDHGVANLIETAETAPANLVDGRLFPGDRLSVNGLPIGSGLPDFVRINRAVPIQLSIGGAVEVLHSAAPTLGEALWENGVRLYEGDRLTPHPHTPLDGPLQAELVWSAPLTIHSARQTIPGRTAGEIVGEALADAGLTLAGLDYSVPDESALIPGDGQIQVVRVTEEVQMEQEPLAFDVLWQPIPTLEIDNQQIVQPGAYGVLTNRIRVRLEDGTEASRTVEGEWVAQEPTPQIQGYGTDIRVRTVSTADGPLDYWRAVQMYATSYSPSRAGVSPDAPWFGITASGKRLVKGLVAIDRNLIPFGTQMYVPGYGFAEAADTGSGVKGRWIDLGYEDDNWLSWSGYVTVYFLTPTPSPDSIVYIFP